MGGCIGRRQSYIQEEDSVVKQRPDEGSFPLEPRPQANLHPAHVSVYIYTAVVAGDIGSA